jgi:hypothetical protein
VGEDGQVLYAASVVKTGKRVGTKEEQGVSSDAKLDGNQYLAAAATLKKMQWDFVVPCKKALDKESSNQELEKKTVAKLEEACCAMNRTSKDAERCLPSILKLGTNSGVKSSVELKSTLKMLYKHISHVSEIHMGLSEPWKNSEQLRDYLVAAAHAAIACQDAVDVAKALVASHNKA